MLLLLLLLLLLLRPPSPLGSPVHPTQQQQPPQQQLAAPAAAVYRHEEYPSEDVAPSELLLAGGRGVWAPHASLSPQLNVILEEGASLSTESQELSTAAADAAAAAIEQQLQLANQDAPLAAAPECIIDRQATPATGQAAGVLLLSHQQPTSRNQNSEVAGLDPAPGQQQEQVQMNSMTSAPSVGTSFGLGMPPTAAQVALQAPQEQQQQQEDVAAAAAAGEVEDAEGRSVGAVSWAVYQSYWRAVGWAMCGAVLVSLLAMQVMQGGGRGRILNGIAGAAPPAAAPQITLLVIFFLAEGVRGN
jgi:hypothetical protein